MNKLQRFAENYAAQRPAELLDGVGHQIAYVAPSGNYVVLCSILLDEPQAQRLLAWLKDLLEEPTP